MKRILISSLTLFFAFNLKADISELENSGNQLYEDGFSLISWQKFDEAYSQATKEEDKLRLLDKMSKTALDSSKAPETLKYLTEYLKKTTKISVEARSTLLLNKALLLLNSSNYKEAVVISEQILKNLTTLPKDIQSKVLDTALYSFIKNAELKRASQLIEANFKLFPNQDKVELQNARIKILLNEIVSAQAILDKYSDSKEILPHFLAMWAYLKLGDFNKSFEIYTKYFKTVTSAPDPAFTTVMIKLAESTYKEKLKESMAVLDMTLALEKDQNIQAYIYLKKAELLVLAGSSIEAIQALERFLSVYPKSNKVLRASLQLADLYFGTENQDLVKAAALLNKVIDSNPKDKRMMYDALILRSKVKLAAGTLKDAAGDLSTAAELAQTQKYTADLITHPLYSAGLAKYTEAEKSGVKEAFNDASNSFFSAASIKSTYRLKAALMQIQALRRAESYTMAVQNLKKWIKIFPSSSDLNYLLGISLLEDRKTVEGLKALKKFSLKFPEDQRVPMTYVHALRASIYGPDAHKMKKRSEGLISEFEQKLSSKGPLVKNYTEVAPHVLHLKAIFSWKHNYKTEAVNYWNEFLKKYESHPLVAEVYIWLAYKSKSSENPDYAVAIKNYTSAMSLLSENPLKAYGLTQLGKTLKDDQRFEEAVESLEKAIKVYKSMKLDDAISSDLSTLLFFAGDMYSRMGLYENKAIIAFKEALELTPDLNVKLALKGRIADCIFSHSTSISGQDGQEKEYLLKLQEALTIYKEIVDDKNASPAIKEQALYKLAKCYETLGHLKEKNHINKELALAVDSYKELFFSFQNDMKNGKRRDHYYFCRAGYDLARLHLNFEEPALIPAINTYKILAKSGFPGTAHAREMLKFLKDAQKKIDNE